MIKNEPLTPLNLTYEEYLALQESYYHGTESILFNYGRNQLIKQYVFLMELIRKKIPDGKIYDCSGLLNLFYLSDANWEQELNDFEINKMMIEDNIRIINELKPFMPSMSHSIQPVYLNGHFIASIMNKHKYYLNFDSLKGRRHHMDVVISFFRILLSNLKEMTTMGLYPMDMDLTNALYDYNSRKVEIIDYESPELIIGESNDPEKLNDLLNLYLNMLFEVVYFKLLIAFDYNLENQRLVFNIPLSMPSDIITAITRGEVNYEVVNETLKVLKMKPPLAKISRY